LKIAIVKLSAMGDIIHAMVALELIKNKLPNIKIDWIVEESFACVLENNPNINNIVTVNLKKLKKSKLSIFGEIKKIKSLSKENYNLIIDAQGLIKSAIVARLLSSNVAGFSKDSIREKQASYLYKKNIQIDYAANTIDRNVKVITQPLGIEFSKEDILNKKPFLFFKQTKKIDRFLSNSKKNIVFIIGSTWESRNYPKESFLKIANELKENILITWGSKLEEEKAKWLESQSKYITALPKLNLNELKELISKCDLTIGNDTGPTHMAWGLNRPSITIFGPTPVSRVYITDINKVVKSSSIVNPYKLNKNDYSIEEIKPDLIVNMAKDLL